MKDILTRSISGIVFIAIMIGSIFGGKVIFALSMGVISLLTLSEFYNLFAQDKSNSNIKGLFSVKIAIGLLCYMTLTMPLVNPIFGTLSTATVMMTLLLFTFLLFFMFIIELFWGSGDVVKNIGIDILGIIYVVVPFALLSYIGNPDISNEGFDKFLVLSFLCIIWVNDTFAYLSGITFGKHKMFERVSPKKSWEGFTGGLIFSLLAGWGFSFLTGYLSGFDWLWLSLIISISSVLGDFFESLLKRSVGVKDSGNIIPGHGGLLDRFDAMLFASPMTALGLFILTNIINNA